MKYKTSITLSEDVLTAVDRLLGPSKNRSEFIETVLRAYLKDLARREREVQDLQIINQHASRLNAEALDVLAYQGDW